MGRWIIKAFHLLRTLNVLCNNLIGTLWSAYVHSHTFYNVYLYVFNINDRYNLILKEIIVQNSIVEASAVSTSISIDKDTILKTATIPNKANTNHLKLNNENGFWVFFFMKLSNRCESSAIVIFCYFLALFNMFTPKNIKTLNQ